ncbi:hypothetical protein [Bartonella sp. CR84HXZ]|uniref:hypothetical protein n=1 Tax=Bartonella sp. CR84HXZ TaxID=1460997 RepID=UPI0035CFD4EC
MGIETTHESIPSETITTKNVCKTSRELKKWQAEKKFKQKNFVVRAHKYNESIPNSAFHFKAYPETENQLIHYNNHITTLKRNIVKDSSSKRLILINNFLKAKDDIIKDMVKRHFIKKRIF